MNKIKQLDDVLANKIAAGEVIERPANVVKELVENSIDANSTKIEIIIEDGGLQLIQVVDNGDGMSSYDAKMCFSRHATSKISDDHDLFCIQTLGFRGEAIPSIASISEFVLKTCDDNEATMITYNFGKLESIKETDFKKGTNISISKLFQNVPARLKYIKSSNSEYIHIQNYVERLALSHPNIAFTLVNNGKVSFKSNGNNNLLEVISNIYGLSVAKKMIPIKFNDEEFEITGYVGKIDVNRASKNHIITMVNHRVVRNFVTMDAVNKAYRQYLADNRYPIALINIDIDPVLVDVNVHPSKLEVKFSKEYKLKELIFEGVSNALKGEDLTYEATPKKIFKPNIDQAALEFDYSKPDSIIKEPVVHEPRAEYIVEEPQLVVNEDLVVNKPTVEEPKKVMKQKLFVKGQVHGTYIICEDKDNMYLVDQHAAQERVNYEYFLEKYSKLDLTMRDLLIPITVEYPMSECMIIEENKDMLTKVGINIELFGNGFVIKQLPMWMNNIDEGLFIEDMINQILNDKTLDVVALQEHAIATLACKASLKGNSYLNIEAMQTVIDNLMCCDNPYVCPHGRPTIISYSSYELEKLFRRVV